MESCILTNMGEMEKCALLKNIQGIQYLKLDNMIMFKCTLRFRILAILIYA